LVWTAGIVVVLGLAGFGAARWFLSNSWFVGIGENGNVTIYQGIPDEIAGASFADVEETTDISEEEVPESFRDDLQESKKFESLEKAQAYVAAVQQRIDEIEEATEQEPERKKDRRS
jgi:protein phosphatase